jgi:hypothetical protein
MSDLETIQEKINRFQAGEPVSLSGEEIDLFMRGAAFVKREDVERVIRETESEEKFKQLALGMLDSIPDEDGLVCCYTLGHTMQLFLGEFSKVPPDLMRIRYRITNTDRVPIVKTRDGFDPNKLVAAQIRIDDE